MKVESRNFATGEWRIIDLPDHYSMVTVTVAKGQRVPPELSGVLPLLAVERGVATTEICVSYSVDIPFGREVLVWRGQRELPADSLIVARPSKVVPFRAPTPRVVRWSGTYAEYCTTPEFHRLAAEAKKEWNYQCLLCGRGPVEAHHRSYAHVPFGETWRDLVPLCEDCHGRYHNRLPKPPIGLFDQRLDERAA